MKISFNLSKFKKQANYDDGRGLIQKQTRSFQNCQKAKREKGMDASEAWFSCLEEYQNSSGNDWATKYAGHS
jgi:hypothetical protein